MRFFFSTGIFTHWKDRCLFQGQRQKKWRFGLVSLISTHSIDFNWFELFSIVFNWFKLFSIGFNWFELLSIVFNWFGFRLVWIGLNWFQLFWIGLNCSDRAWSTSRGGWPAHCDARVGRIQTTGFKGFKEFKRHVSKDSKDRFQRIQRMEKTRVLPFSVIMLWILKKNFTRSDFSSEVFTFLCCSHQVIFPHIRWYRWRSTLTIGNYFIWWEAAEGTNAPDKTWKHSVEEKKGEKSENYNIFPNCPPPSLGLVFFYRSVLILSIFSTNKCTWFKHTWSIPAQHRWSPKIKIK